MGGIPSAAGGRPTALRDPVISRAASRRRRSTLPVVPPCNDRHNVERPTGPDS